MRLQRATGTAAEAFWQWYEQNEVSSGTPAPLRSLIWAHPGNGVAIEPEQLVEVTTYLEALNLNGPAVTLVRDVPVRK